MPKTTTSTHHVVIVGGGFGGLYAVQGLANLPVSVTLVDKRNFHLFQPLLYQVASGALSPGDIAVSLRDILANQKNVDVLLANVEDINPAEKTIVLEDGRIHYDTLILAPGSQKQYFGHEDWEACAPGLKTLEDAVRIRRRVLFALEAAEKEPDAERKKSWMTYVVVGGGPTGVEMAGTMAELVHGTFKKSFRHINTDHVRILLVEASPNILSAYSPRLQNEAERKLESLGVEVFKGKMVQRITDDNVVIAHYDEPMEIASKTVIWTAGVKTSPLARILADKTGCELDKGGRIQVERDCSVPGHPEIFVIGDLCMFRDDAGKPLPGLASVAMQEGRYVAGVIQSRLSHQPVSGFHYKDRGSLAIIGRNAAVGKVGKLEFTGFPAWVIWLFIHIFYLIGFENKVMVVFQWAWNYLTRVRSACLITKYE